MIKINKSLDLISLRFRCMSNANWAANEIQSLRQQLGGLQQRVIELNIEVSQYKEAIHNYK